MLEKAFVASDAHVHRLRLRGRAMIRVLTADEPNATTITVDGQLVGDSVDAVEKCSDQAIYQGKPVYLFLRDVSHIDEHGRSLLSRLNGKGVRLSASGVYSSYIVAEISKGQRQPPNVRSRTRAHSRH
jgi:hypothetical protein